MQRRKFLKDSATLVGTLPLLSFSPFQLSLVMEREISKIKLGQFDCTIFRDLQFKYLAKDYFINANAGELNLALQRHRLSPDNIPSPFIAVLLQAADRKILIDTGIGFAEKPVVFRGNTYALKGRLHQLLESEKVKGEDITDVILTHCHPDHIGGVYSEAGMLHFPNATFHLHEDEWNFWHSSGAEKQPPLFSLFIEKQITPLKSQKLNLLKGEASVILPGITALKAEGHTPGQIVLHIQSEKEQLLYISDAFLHPLHIERIDWQTNYDMDHEKAKATRIRLLEMAYRYNMLVNAFHFDFPGLGRVDKRHNNWVWKYTRT